MTLETLEQPVVVSAPPKMTFEAFLEWIPEDVRAEWVDGEVSYLSPVSIRHQDIADFLTALVRHFIEAHHLGVVRSSPILMKLSSRPSGREPDMLFVAAANLSRLRGTFIDGPADLVLEIVSPDSRNCDCVDKKREYEAAGVREYWLLDPAFTEAKFYQLGANGRFVEAALDEDGIYHSAVLPGLWLQVDWLWQDPMPPLMDVLRQWKLV